MQILDDIHASIDEGKYVISLQNGLLVISLLNDLGQQITTIMIERQGTTVTSIEVDGVMWDVQPYV